MENYYLFTFKGNSKTCKKSLKDKSVSTTTAPTQSIQSYVKESYIKEIKFNLGSFLLDNLKFLAKKYFLNLL